MSLPAILFMPTYGAGEREVFIFFVFKYFNFCV